jgi:aryl-phospho-beta-D-glucosidase BglC (GH1 family)
MRENLADFWAFIASWFKGQDAVVGYELINEPFAGM